MIARPTSNFPFRGFAALTHEGQAFRKAFPRLIVGALVMTFVGCGGNDTTKDARVGALQPPNSGNQGSAPEGSGSGVSTMASQDSMQGGVGSNANGNAAGPDSERSSSAELALDNAPGGASGSDGSEESDPTTNTDSSAPTEVPSPAVQPEEVVPSPGCGQVRELQNGNQAITSSGANRTYFLATSDTYDNTVPHRLVFMFHWNYGSINAIVNPPDQDQNTDGPFYGMGELADDRTIFVVPQGLVSQATGGAGWDNANNRDVIFTDDVFDAITADLCIDESRVFTTGFSFGAAMSYKLACARGERFRAAAVYNVGNFSGTQADECTTPIPYFATHGVTDGIAQYSNGVAILDRFAELNGCTAMTPPQPGENEHGCVSLEGCSVPTRFCNFGNGQDNPHNPGLNGHYPSAKDPGEDTSWIPAEAWQFITQF